MLKYTHIYHIICPGSITLTMNDGSSERLLISVAISVSYFEASHNRQYKAPTDSSKLQKTIQRDKISDEHLKYLTRVATNIILTHIIQYPILATQIIN